MNMLLHPRVVIKCHTCKEEFGVQLRHFENKQSIQCQSCGQMMDVSAFAELRESVIHLNTAIKTLAKESEVETDSLLSVLDGGRTSGFSIRIDWNEKTSCADSGLFRDVVQQ